MSSKRTGDKNDGRRDGAKSKIRSENLRGRNSRTSTSPRQNYTSRYFNYVPVSSQCNNNNPSQRRNDGYLFHTPESATKNWLECS